MSKEQEKKRRQTVNHPGRGKNEKPKDVESIIKEAKWLVEEELMNNDIFAAFNQMRKEHEEKFMVGAREYARVRIVDRPTRRLKAMIALRDDLLDLSEELQLKLKTILERYKEETYDGSTDEGLLRNHFDEFNACYHIDIE